MIARMEITATELEGRLIRLEPLAWAHRDGLQAAADDSRIWPYMFLDGSGENFEPWFVQAHGAHDSGRECHFVVRVRESGAIVGSSRYINLAPEHKRLEIGSTWYAPSVWGGFVNPECKLLMMTHAFETLGVNRIDFRCDGRNNRSRKALHRLGAVEEGVLRRHMIVQHGYVRDTVQFGVTTDDWPGIKAGLVERLAG